MAYKGSAEKTGVETALIPVGERKPRSRLHNKRGGEDPIRQQIDAGIVARGAIYYRRDGRSNGVQRRGVAIRVKKARSNR